MALIEGSRPQISSETANLLRGRLRASAGVLGLGFGLFFVYRLLSGDGPGRRRQLHVLFPLRRDRGVDLVVFPACADDCEISLKVLAQSTSWPFSGCSVAYFLVYDYKLLTMLAKRNYLSDPLALWIGTVFIYAMFIPNTWRTRRRDAGPFVRRRALGCVSMDHGSHLRAG